MNPLRGLNLLGAIYIYYNNLTSTRLGIIGSGERLLITWFHIIIVGITIASTGIAGFVVFRIFLGEQNLGKF